MKLNQLGRQLVGLLAKAAPLLLVAGSSFVAPQLLLAQQPTQFQTAAHFRQSALVQAEAIPSPPGISQDVPQPQPSLSLANLEELALCSNPSLARAQAQVQMARGNWIQVGLPPNPSVGYSGQQLGSGGLAEQHGIYVTQEIVRGGKLNLNRQAAAHEVAQAEQNVIAQQFRVLTDVRMAFYQVLIAQRQIDVAHVIAGNYTKAVETTDRLFQAQEISKLEVLQAKFEYETAQVTLRNAQHRHAAAWQSLTAVVGQPHLAPQALAGDAAMAPKPFDYQQTLQHILSASPEIAAAVSNIERARWAYQRALVEKKGNVNVQGLYNWQDNGIGGQPDGSLVVDMPIPIWNKNQGGIVRAQGEVAVAERALQQVELDLQQRLAPVYERYQNARNQVERYEKTILTLAKESSDLSRKAFQAGELNYLSLLLAERSFATANLAYLDALRDLRLAEAEMDGFLLQNSLSAR
ncbi:Cobalt-zinc-cadmium resistance protein CzcC precursor [Anatilimnocola aggregata]|uniref:Cobalt-zinc-cadmium resistance protein CzcC n=1 Tax=Anatilimnocola aggregata TaxID=2528021 RepID=A0A517Y7T5_9BACT|nr:TolC family protein [Anatilimnocola aggregata]QDU26283.1 Cobalt-zinc-cadmium resistance protein CzcC precursor [Anatilimnocola aggregata]